MKIAFTICSNNYLSQAKTLADSFFKYNDEYKFIIGLCDKKNELIDYSIFSPCEIVEVEELCIENFEWMVYNYNIIELNTATKPYYFQYFLKTYQDIDYIFYLDPDIQVFNSFSILEKELENKDILLTPHITTPLPNDKKVPNENLFLNYGIFNLGFLGLRKSTESEKMLEWWADKMAYDALDDVSGGYFVDQLPMNYVPIFFERVGVSKNLGNNVSYWNLHERKLSHNATQRKYFINNIIPLVFYHFSSFKPSYPLTMSIYQNRYILEENNDLYDLYKQYTQVLENNNYAFYKTIPCYYVVLRNKRIEENSKIVSKNEKVKTKAIRKIKRMLYPIYSALLK